jgi:hypothetical protein
MLQSLDLLGWVVLLCALKTSVAFTTVSTTTNRSPFITGGSTVYTRSNNNDACCNNANAHSNYNSKSKSTRLLLKQYKFDEDFFKDNEEDGEDGANNANNANNDDNDDNDDEIKNEQQASVRRKKKNGKQGYRTLDNRDNLPYIVKLVTPDPYTPEAVKKAEQAKAKRIHIQKQQDADVKQNQQKPNMNHNKKKKSKRTDLLVGSGISASIYAKSATGDGSLEQVLGEFTLDKSTHSGDIIAVGDMEYEVQVARCQYKYAGGKRFVMVRKILEVKEVARAAQEESFRRALELNLDSDTTK